jgi:hypothetical protein
MGRLCFPKLIQIVDFYHALEHAGRVLVALLGSKEHPEYKVRLGRWASQLLKDRVEKLIAEVRQQCAGRSCAEAVDKELGYFVNNVERMRYGTFRRKGFFIGSGVVEAGCKNRHRRSLQTIQDVLESTRSRKRLGIALHWQQPSVGSVLERTPQRSRRP